MLIWDIETDGLLDELTKVHTLHIIDTEDGRRYRFNDGVFADGTPAPRDGSIIDGLKMLASAKAICGHNIIPFDIPALVKVYPWFRLHPERSEEHTSELQSLMSHSSAFF